MPHAGRQLTWKEALALCYEAGFRDKGLVTAVAVMAAESARFIKASHDNAPAGGLGIDRGLFQINSYWHRQLSDEEAYRARPNIAYAFQLSSKGRDWTAWSTYKSKAHVKYLPVVQMVKARGGWRKLVR